MKVIFASVVLVITSCSLMPDPISSSEHYFLTEVKPVLQQQCLRCHNGVMPAPALNLTSKATALRPDGRKFIVPGKPDQSLLLTAVRHRGTPAKRMPHADVSLTDDQIGMLREWIEDGAYWPAGSRGTLRPQASREIPDQRSILPVHAF